MRGGRKSFCVQVVDGLAPSRAAVAPQAQSSWPPRTSRENVIIGRVGKTSSLCSKMLKLRENTSRVRASKMLQRRIPCVVHEHVDTIQRSPLFCDGQTSSAPVGEVASLEVPTTCKGCAQRHRAVRNACRHLVLPTPTRTEFDGYTFSFLYCLPHSLIDCCGQQVA